MILIFESEIFICVFLTELLFKFLHVAKLFDLLGFEPRSMLEVLVLKNAAECTSQRFK